METANLNLGKKFDRLEKKVDRLITMFEDLTLTPQQYSKLAKVDEAVKRGKHKKWKTIDQALRG